MLEIGQKSSSKEKELNHKKKKLMRKRIMMTTPARRVWMKISATGIDTYVSAIGSVLVVTWERNMCVSVIGEIKIIVFFLKMPKFLKRGGSNTVDCLGNPMISS